MDMGAAEGTRRYERVHTNYGSSLFAKELREFVAIPLSC